MAFRKTRRARRLEKKLLKEKAFPRKLKSFIEHLSDEVHWDARLHAAQALARIAEKEALDERVVSLLAKRLKADNDSRVRHWCADALGKTRQEKAIKKTVMPALIKAFKKDSVLEIRLEAAVALSKLGYWKMVSNLFDMLLKIEYKETQKKLASAITRIALNKICLKENQEIISRNIRLKEPSPKEALIVYAIAVMPWGQKSVSEDYLKKLMTRLKGKSLSETIDDLGLREELKKKKPPR